jgi:hypothetical protein
MLSSPFGQFLDVELDADPLVHRYPGKTDTDYI